MVEIQQTAVQNQTAVMIEIGTNLLNQTAEQTRKLTDVEAQVSNGFQPQNASASQTPTTTNLTEFNVTLFGSTIRSQSLSSIALPTSRKH